VYSGKLILAAIYLRRIEIEFRSYAAAPTQVSKAVTPPAPAEKNLGVGCGGPARQMCSGTELLLTGLSGRWQIFPRSDGAGRPAPASKKIGVGLLVTALAYLHVRNLARRFD
jgi:hypothetical protein